MPKKACGHSLTYGKVKEKDDKKFFPVYTGTAHTIPYCGTAWNVVNSDLYRHDPSDEVLTAEERAPS